MRPNQLLLLALLTALALVVAACGGTPTTPPVTHTLTVTVEGNGSGEVTFNPAGTPAAPSPCTDDCTKTYNAGTSVTITAAPAANNAVTWGGDCAAAALNTCTLNMNAAKNVTVTFTAESGGGVTSVTINQGAEAVTVAEGRTVTLAAQVVATGSAATTVNWRSSDETIAQVSPAGVVTGVAVGPATITATSSFDATKSDTILVNVVEDGSQAVNSVTIEEGRASVAVVVGATRTLAVAVDATGGADESVTWQSSNGAVATVDPATGAVTGVAVGQVTVTATSSFDDTKNDTILVNVVSEASACPEGETCVVLEFLGSGEGNVFINGDGPYTTSTAVPVSAGTALIQTQGGTVVAWGGACANIKAGNQCAVTMNGESQTVSIAFASSAQATASTRVTDQGLPDGSSDDVEEFKQAFTTSTQSFAVGDLLMTSGTIELTYDKRGFDQYVGLRFRNLEIPQNATIVKAYIQFRGSETTSNSPEQPPLVLTLYAQDNAKAPAFIQILRNVSSTSQRPRLAQTVTWQPENWTTLSPTLEKQTPNLASLMQPLVNKSNWASGDNAVVFIIDSNDTLNYRAALAYTTGNPEGAAQLVVIYEP